MPGPFDLITSNPPYLRDDEVADMRKLGWPEPELALRGGRDGTAAGRAARSAQAPARLAPGGWLLLEAAPPQINKLSRSWTRRASTASTWRRTSRAATG